MMGAIITKLPIEDTPLGARIVAVADVYDALTTDCPYRKAFSPLQAQHEILANASTHFDPNVVKAFNEIFPYLENGKAVSYLWNNLIKVLILAGNSLAITLMIKKKWCNL